MMAASARNNPKKPHTKAQKSPIMVQNRTQMNFGYISRR